MLEYSEAPALASLYHEVLPIEAGIQAGENSSSAAKKLPAPAVEEKDLDKPVDRELPTSEPKTGPRSPERPRRR